MFEPSDGARARFRHSRSGPKHRRLLWGALGLAALFEAGFGLGGGRLLADKLGDAALFVAAASGYYNYYEECPNGCDDGNACTTDSCVNGSCTHSTINCNDGNACNGTETCNPSSGCQAGTPPQCDDNNQCNGLEWCEPSSGCKPGTALVCDDFNECTEDRCLPASGCQFPPKPSGTCCTEDSNDCTKDICDGAGSCTHPPKPDPLPVSPTVSWSVSKNYGKNADLPIIGRAIGLKTQFSLSAEAGVGSEEDECSFNGEVSGSAIVRTEFIGQTFEIEGSASGGWGCSMPYKCPQGCNNRQECDTSKKCCSAEGSGSIGIRRGFKKRWGTKFGSLYVNASVGGGVEGSASKTFPACTENHWSVTLGPFFEASAGGGVEICNWLTKRICGCSQGRDPWTGQFQTACSDCSRCSPYAGATISGRLAGSITWSDQGVSGAVSGKACFNMSPIQVGPFELEGYEKCWEIKGET